MMQPRDLLAGDGGDGQLAEPRLYVKADVAAIFLGRARLLLCLGMLGEVAVAKLLDRRRRPRVLPLCQRVATSIYVPLQCGSF